MRTSAVFSGMLAIMIAACGGQDETPFTEPHRTGTLPAQSRPAENSRFFQSEQDEFHPNSIFESVRKTRLTDFGYNPEKPPALTRTRGEAHQQVIDAGVQGLYVTGFRSAQFQKPVFPFDYENDIARLRRLAQTHRLDTLMTDDMDEMQKMTALLAHTYRFMEGGTVPDPGDDPGPSAELITARRRDGIGGEARHYAALFCQLALSIGYNARLVGMHFIDQDGTEQSHMIAEVFLNDNRKWVAFDPYEHASYFMRDVEPLSALELHGMMLDNNYRSVDMFSLAGDFIVSAAHKEQLLKHYRYLYLFRMNDILSRSPRNGSMSWQELYQAHLVWEDTRSLVSEGQYDRVAAFADTSNPSFPLSGVRFVAHEADVFNWDLNYAILTIRVEPTTDFQSPSITTHFNTVTPNFNEFVLEDDKAYHTTSYSHKIQLVVHGFTMSPINEFGVVGQQAYIDFSW